MTALSAMHAELTKGYYGHETLQNVKDMLRFMKKEKKEGKGNEDGEDKKDEVLYLADDDQITDEFDEMLANLAKSKIIPDVLSRDMCRISYQMACLNLLKRNFIIPCDILREIGIYGDAIAKTYDSNYRKIK